MSVNVKKTLRKSQAQFQEKLRKLRLKQNYGFLIKKTCTVFVYLVTGIAEWILWVNKTNNNDKIIMQISTPSHNAFAPNIEL